MPEPHPALSIVGWANRRALDMKGAAGAQLACIAHVIAPGEAARAQHFGQPQLGRERRLGHRDAVEIERDREMLGHVGFPRRYGAAIGLDPRFHRLSYVSCRYFSRPAALSIPVWTQGSSLPGVPDSPAPPITSSPALIGSPPGMAMMLGSVTCWCTTGLLSA